MQGSNYTQELKDAGLRSPAKTNYQWDIEPFDTADRS